jgi:hypothetical protein
MPPEMRLEVKRIAENNVLPENKSYHYHHFRENCATPIVRIIDFITGGQFSEKYEYAEGRFTLRQHVRRHTWFSPVADWILNFWMGQVIDTPITVWQEMFLPSEVAKRIENFEYIDADGVKRNLVSKMEVFYKANARPPVLDYPPKQWPRKLVFSLVVSAIVGLFFFMQSKKIRAGQILAGISMSFAGLVFGFAGLCLYFLVFFTNHDYTFENLNVLFASPLLLASIPLGIRYAIIKDAEKRFVTTVLLKGLWFLSVLGIVVSMLLKILPQFWHDNLTDQMLMLPIALAFVLNPDGQQKILQKVFQRKK